ncbi:MAG: right-handed parallel beta-helix repeat-containing protein [bacterium]
MKSIAARFALAVLSLLIPAVSAHAAVRYVVAPGAGFGNTPDGQYLSPASAANTVTDALAVAVPGDSILVAGGTNSILVYAERITLKAGVALLGGYSVQPPAFTVRDADIHQSELDGTPLSEGSTAGTVVTVESGAGAGTIIEGFRIRGGGPTIRGGGILASAASPTIRDNIFFFNSAGSSTGGGGSGIRLESGSTAIVDGNTFVNNTAQGASGTLHLVDSSPSVTNNIFFRELGGAAIVCEGVSSNPSVRFNAFSNNPRGDILCDSPDSSNNLYVNPLLCDPDAGVFTLFDESLVIGAGENGRTIGATGPGCHASVKYVSTSGVAIYPYASPAQAADSISTVLRLAVPGDTVRVAAGVYQERIVVPPGVRVEGNWNQNFSERDTERDPSVIDGEGRGSVVTFTNDGGNSATLDGFAITDGFASDGSAVSIANASPILSGLTIVLNANANGSGGVVAVNGGAPEIVNTVIAFNHGSGVTCSGGANVDIHHSGLFGNTGGAVTGCSGTLPTSVLLSDPLFCNASGCALVEGRWSCQFQLKDFHLFGESEYRDGGEGGIRIGALRVNCNRTAHFVSTTGANTFPYTSIAGASTSIAQTIAVASPGDTVHVAAGTYDEAITLKEGVRVEGGWNAAFSSRDAGANETIIRGNVPGQATIFSTGAEVTPDAQLAGFTITHVPGVLGTGIEIRDSAAPLIVGNVVRGNTTPNSGAGILVDGGLATILNNTIFQNQTTSVSEANRAGGVHLRNIAAGFSFRRNIVYDNDGGYGVSCSGSFSTLVGREVNTNILFANEGVPGGRHPDSLSLQCTRVPATANFVVDPKFCDYASGEITLFYSSPARLNACGDDFVGARGVGCITHPHKFFVSAGNDLARFPYGGGDCAAARLADVLPLMEAGDSLLVSAGTYPVDVTPLVIPSGVTLLGNFTPDFSSRTSNSTITGESRAPCLVIAPGVDSTTVIDGFNFTKGRALRGAGIFVSGGSSPIIRGVAFRDMVADSGGAAIYCAPGSSPKIRRCVIARNRLSNPRSSMVVVDGASPEISNCTFFDNLTVGIDILSGSPEVFNNIVFRCDRGGIRCAPAANATVDHNLASSNDDFDFSGCTPVLGDGNTTEGPRFCSTDGTQLTLFDNSPAATGGRGGVTMGAFPVACVTSAHFVSPAGDSLYPYTSPLNATRRLQDALDVAGMRGRQFVPGFPFDTVYVAGGVYEADITIPPNVVLLAGYEPNFGIIDTSSRFDARLRDINVYPVIIRGSGEGSVATVDSGGFSISTIIDGLVIRGGRAQHGGGVFVSPGGAATFRNCAVDSCTATVAGGGVYLSPGPASVFEFCSASRDSAPLGSALYADSTISVISNCTFVENVAGPGGATMEIGNGGSSVVRNIIANNEGIGLKVERALNAGGYRDNIFWMNSVADTSLPGTLGPTNRVADPKFCDPDNGDFTIRYSSPGVLRPCARLQPPFLEIAGRYPVGCTDEGHTFLARSGNSAATYPYACPDAATSRISDAASRASFGDTIRVSGQTGGGAVYNENIVVNDRISLLGGWNLSFTERAPATNISVITSSMPGTLLTVESPKDLSGNIIDSLVIDSTAVISGFTFSDGNAALENGGAILCVDASPLIAENIFRENATLNFGGAVCALGSVNQPIRRNRFLLNSAAHGGAIYLGECESPIVSENVIFSNRAELRGGGIRLAQYSGAPRIHDNTIASNTGEGISFAGGNASAEIYNNVVAFNTRSGFQHFPAPPGETSPRQHHNLFWANIAGNFEATQSGEGDVFLSPLFCVRAASDYRLQKCSPAIGAGADSVDSVIGHVRDGDAFCADTDAPEVSIRFLKNSIVPRFIDIYVVFSERVEDSTLVVSKVCENQPAIPLTVTLTDTAGTIYGVQGIETSNCGELQVVVNATDLCDSSTTASRSVSTAIVAPGGAAVVSNKTAHARIEIAESRAAREQTLLLASVPAPRAGDEIAVALEALGKPIGEACEALGLEAFGGDAALGMRIPESVAPEAAGAIALYRRDGSGWIREPAVIDAANRVVLAHPAEDGVFQLVLTGNANTSSTLPTRLALFASAPNPAPGRTSIAFDLPASSHAALRVYDVSGRRVTTIVERTLPAGRHAFGWNGTDHSGKEVPSGIYFYELSTSQATEVRKLVLVR